MKKIIIPMILSMSMITSIVVSAEDVSITSENDTQILINDINNDGVVNVLDTLALKNHIIEGKTVSTYNYDTNGDGVSNKVDLIQNKRTSFGLSNFSYYNDGIYDNFEMFNTSLLNTEENASKIVGNCVIVTIKHQYSIPNKVWSAEDFDVDNIESIVDLSKFNNLQGEELERYLSSTTFRQRLCINLKETGIDNVIKMIDDLQSSNNIEVQSVFPNVHLKITYNSESTTPTYD